MENTRAEQYWNFWTQMAAGVNGAGAIPIIATIDDIKKGMSTSDKFEKGIREIAQKIHKGVNLSEAMAATKLFSEMEINVIRSCEVFGNWRIMPSRLRDTKALTRANQYIDFYATLGILLQCEVPILHALKISGQKLDKPLSNAVQQIYDFVAEGKSVSAGMAKSGMFHKHEVSWIKRGEKENKLALYIINHADISKPSE